MLHTMNMSTTFKAVIASFLILSATGCSTGGHPTRPTKGAESAKRTFTILAINDLYRAEGFLETDEAGLARVRALRQELEKGNEVLFLHAGDFLFPSLLSREFDGRQMVSAMNLLDGDLDFDDRMLVTFGNHEFEKEGWDDLRLLQARLDESQFDWLGANVRFLTKDGLTIRSSRIMAHKVLELGGIKVGVYGVTKQVPDLQYAQIAGKTSELIAESEDQIRLLRNQGAQVVIALTHLGVANDRRLLAHDVAPDILLGGHDHAKIGEMVNGRHLLKADSDGRGAWEVTVVADSGTVRFSPRYHDIRKGAQDPQLQDITEVWVKFHDAILCRKRKLSRGCLSDAFGMAAEDLIAEEMEIRSRTTNVGNHIADQMLELARTEDRKAFAEAVAFLNSGAIRLNRNIPSGTPFTRRALEELLEYESDLFYKDIPGQELKQALDHSVACRESGPWLQVSDNLRFHADLTSHSATHIRINNQPFDPGKSYRVITNAFLAGHAGGDRDLYQLGAGWQNVRANGDGSALRKAICRGLNECQTENSNTPITMPDAERVVLPADAPRTGGASAACGVDN